MNSPNRKIVAQVWCVAQSGYPKPLSFFERDHDLSNIKTKPFDISDVKKAIFGLLPHPIVKLHPQGFGWAASAGHRQIDFILPVEPIPLFLPERRADNAGGGAFLGLIFGDWPGLLQRPDPLLG